MNRRSGFRAYSISAALVVSLAVLGLVACSEDPEVQSSAAEFDESDDFDETFDDSLDGSEESTATERVAVPRVIGKKLAQARRALAEKELRASVTKRFSSKPAGTVIKQTPISGSRRQEGARVRLVVSKGPPPPPPPPPEPPEESTGSGGSNCTAGYSPCLPPASDYDCAGGSGDGPKYTGTVTVTGSDPYGLDSDGDGVGCE